LESIGELSAGIAHEINTPVQFIANNLDFLRDSFDDVVQILEAYEELKETAKSKGDITGAIDKVENLIDEIDLEYLQEETPNAFEQTKDGVDRVTTLVLGMKGFAHSTTNDDKKKPGDVNKIISNSLIVSQNAYKYVADMELDLGEIPEVSLFANDIGQVIINLVINASHAIEDRMKDTGEKGEITIRTFEDEGSVVVSIKDTGGGISEKLKERIFDPFFTTKDVGRGSGQGLAISRTIVHEKHGGELSFESEMDNGTTFVIRLPVA